MATPSLGPEVPHGAEHKRKAPPAQSRVRRSSGNGHGPRLRELLPVVEIVGGFIAITQVVCELRGVPARVAAYYSVVAVALLLAVAVGVMYRQEMLVRVLGYLNRVPSGVVWMVALGATIALIGVMLRPKDAWQAWGRDLSHVVRDCQQRGAESSGEDNDPVGQCIAAGLKGTPPPHLAESGVPDTFAQLARDVRAGVVVFQNQELTKRLNGWYGIDERFVGIGTSQPQSTQDSAAERVPEFLTPNYSLQDDSVWVWRLDPRKPEDTSLPISKVLQSQPTNRSNLFAHSDMEVYQRAHHAPNPVIRFALLQESLQPACLGPPQRRRVFASALDAMIDKTVSEAEDYSGYSLRPFPKKEVLYIMVFVPATPDQAVRATWTSILENTAKWTRERTVCQ
ncbi:MAG: hypothetical protein ABSD63_13290 [Candidatus Korobacteraceae bacterium]